MNNKRIAPSDSVDPFSDADAGFQTAEKGRAQKMLMASPSHSLDPDAMD